MAQVRYSACPTFPGEVEDYYCTTCHTPCSGLSLLVGPHTGHNRVPLLQAAALLPAAMRRDARALVAQIHDEYVQPKTAQCTALHTTLEHLNQERQRKTRELEELQSELRALDKKIDSTTQESALVACHWSKQRCNFASRVRLLLRGADALAKTVGLRERSPRSRSMNGAAAADVVPPHTLQTIAKELGEVRQLLTQPLAWLEAGERDPMRSCCVANAVDHERAEAYSWLNCSAKPRSRNSSKSTPSDAKAVLDRLFAAQMELQRAPSPPTSRSVEGDDNDNDTEDGTSSFDGHDDKRKTVERQRWRHDVKRREQLLREGLNRCLVVDTPRKRTATTTATTTAAGDETDVNDISSSSSGGSVNEMVAHLLRGRQGGDAMSTASRPHRRHSHYAVACEDDLS
ncbi:hypothetical protein DQ04_00201180 [Trypanosoma grayi]|uniref:hypothetical protein n=1 Tax=Trypanosoma grayi TaxID=71804 RepID=UPI0004F46CD2|nr:hypothetical protein DQ04_00201180 [Trypanosoma grayi]KEG15065.1 hypothetical protein DQ04_00201180 [Trypanosoma grayi]